MALCISPNHMYISDNISNVSTILCHTCMRWLSSLWSWMLEYEVWNHWIILRLCFFLCLNLTRPQTQCWKLNVQSCYISVVCREVTFILEMGVGFGCCLCLEDFCVAASSFFIYPVCKCHRTSCISHLDQCFKQQPRRRWLRTINLLIITAYPFLPTG